MIFLSQLTSLVMSATTMPATFLDFMKTNYSIPSFLLLFFTSSLFGGEKGWVDLFNGKNLDGWENPYEWGESKVVNGEIELVGNKKFFLSTIRKYSDFEFTGEVKLPVGKANSGFLFRSQRKDNGHMFGYQAEVDGSDRKWSGGLYDEGRRGWVLPVKPENSPKNKELWPDEKRNAFKRNDWNKYRIRCVGEKISVWVNGVQTLDISDDLDSEGYIAIQHHGEKGQVYRFRNLRIKELK
jgi:hypothetical protein